MCFAQRKIESTGHANFLGDHESVFSSDFNVPGIVNFLSFKVAEHSFAGGQQ